MCDKASDPFVSAMSRTTHVIARDCSADRIKDASFTVVEFEALDIYDCDVILPGS